MEFGKQLIQKLADAADLSTESLPGVPVVEIAGKERVIIEGHRGVTAYGNERICVRVSYGYIQVKGCGLELARMTREHLVICGKIHCVELQRRDG